MVENNNKRFSDKLNEFFKGNIKLSFVSERSVVIITNNDECYEFRRDHFKYRIKNTLIALSDVKSKVKSLIEESFVLELSNKQFIDFINDFYKIIGRTIDGKMYYWKRTAIKNAKENVIKFESESHQFLIDVIVKEMCFGSEHILFLTTKGEVYKWNEYDWDKPYKFSKLKNQKIKAISCGFNHSMALTESGQVYSWGSNYWGQLGIGNVKHSFSPKLANLSEHLVIDKISCGRDHSLLLSRDGTIYVCGLNKRGELGISDQPFIITPKKLSHSEKFINIASNFDNSLSAALSINSVYYVWGKHGEQVITELQEKKFISFIDFFEEYFQKNSEPAKRKLIRFNDDLIQNGKHEKFGTFIEEIKIGGGSYGEVFEVIDKRNENIKCAIKKIKFRERYEKEFMKELETLPIIHELNHENIVKYLDVWLENEYTSENGVKSYIQNFILYIQMEFCDKTLNEIIDEIKSTSDFYSNETLTSLGYYIASEIFIGILEGVDYLHKQNPPIIHRDLNPWNIMLKTQKNRNKFVKIADLGLATIHEYVNQSHTQDRGHNEFLSPEVRYSSKYETRADIYSLGIVSRKLFVIDINRNYEIQNESQFEYFFMSKYQKISNLSDKMTQSRVNNRPESIEEILRDKHLWTINFNEFNYKEEFEKFINSKETSESFVFKILKKSVLYRIGKYSKKFIERRKICAGNFGEVFEVSEKYGSKGTYAIQKISLKTMNEELMRELKIIYELNNENIAYYLDVWVENGIQTYIGNFILYIQMHKYDKSLTEIIEEIKNDSDFCSNGTLTLLGYYLVSEVFMIILKGVNDLHKHNPPFIHTNLNPFNIMLIMGLNFHPIVKIAELGLVAFHDYICQSHTEDRVLQDYRAPEVRFDRSYNTSSDIYSLGLVLKDLFLIDVNRDYKIVNGFQSESVLMNKYVEISNLCNRMTQTNVIERPDILSISEEMHLWTLNFEEFNPKEEYEKLRESNELYILKLLKKLINL